MDYDDGEVYVNPNKKLGLISQIPHFPEGYTVEDVLRSAYLPLMRIKAKMESLEKAMSQGATQAQLSEYDNLSNRFQFGGGGHQTQLAVDIRIDILDFVSHGKLFQGHVHLILAESGRNG